MARGCHAPLFHRRLTRLMCDSTCTRCGGDCGHHGGGEAKPEKESCQSCPNRQRCHGKATVVTQDTVLKLIRDAVLEVVRERGL